MQVRFTNSICAYGWTDNYPASKYVSLLSIKKKKKKASRELYGWCWKHACELSSSVDKSNLWVDFWKDDLIQGPLKWVLLLPCGTVEVPLLLLLWVVPGQLQKMVVCFIRTELEKLNPIFQRHIISIFCSIPGNAIAEEYLQALKV